ncbi:MAG: hypothetical protein ACHBN1_21525 [Heteroscytonema crispum UTEX LB 1556]
MNYEPPTNHQPTTNPRGVTLVPRYREALHQSPGSGKRHLRPLGRPQDRSGSPTKGAPSPPTNNQPQRGSPVAWVGKPYQGRPFTSNQT